MVRSEHASISGTGSPSNTEMTIFDRVASWHRQKFIELVFAAFADEPDQRSTEFLPRAAARTWMPRTANSAGPEANRRGSLPSDQFDDLGVISAARPTAARSAASGRDLEAPNSRMMSATEASPPNAMQPS